MDKLKMKIFQQGFNFSQDGPGNRLVFHLQGCNMKCPWCSNPEGRSPKGSIIVDEKYVLDSMCPYGAIKEKKRSIKACSECTNRDCIAENRRSQGIRLSYKEFSTDEVLEIIKKCKSLFYSGGGVTFSGGEATLQADALLEVLSKAKEIGINTAIETNASSHRWAEFLPLIDHLIVDYKIPFSLKHQEIIGIADKIVKENIRYATRHHGDILIRTPLIHNVNDGEEDLQEFIQFYKTCEKSNMKIELLSYHEYGKIKWEQIGERYTMPADAYVSAETLHRFKTALIAEGFRVVHT